MEDSFRVRLDRAFGSLNPSSSSSIASSPLNSLWCLTDEEIQRSNSNKAKHDLLHHADTESAASNLNAFTDQTPSLCEKDLEEADIQDLDDFVEEEDENDSETRCQSAKPDDHSEEEWDIRSSIGLDCTLDFEEEEDEYDKVAIGKDSTTEEEEEEKEERLYLKDENDYEVDMDYYEELPVTLKENIQRDPRANHSAAKLRLKEDAAESSGGDQATSPPLNLKSILKRKEDQSQNRSDKRVRFHLRDDIKEESETITTVESSEDSRVPDHVRNPSRYTHYTFDSVSEMDDESNKKAHLEFLNQLRTTAPEPDNNSPPIDLPKSVVFISRKKQKESQSDINDEAGRKESCKRNRVAIGIAAKGLQENESSSDGVCAMDEDEPEPVEVGIGVNTLKRQARQYRAKEIVD